MSRPHAPPTEVMSYPRIDVDANVLAAWTAADQARDAIRPSSLSSGPAEEPLDSKVCWPC